MASRREVEDRITAIVEGAGEFGQVDLAVKLIMRELNIAANDGYLAGYEDARADRPNLLERMVRHD